MKQNTTKSKYDPQTGAEFKKAHGFNILTGSDAHNRPSPPTVTGRPSRLNFTGVKFRVDRYDCLWTVLRYHRAGNWVCQEPDHNTTCHFHESEILTGRQFQVFPIYPTQGLAVNADHDSALSPKQKQS